MLPVSHRWTTGRRGHPEAGFISPWRQDAKVSLPKKLQGHWEHHTDAWRCMEIGLNIFPPPGTADRQVGRTGREAEARATVREHLSSASLADEQPGAQCVTALSTPE